jgi:peptidoglycan hydrolase-like protein with peptidoglycan-binding domain
MTDYPTYAGRKTLDEIRRWSTFKGLHPTMQERVAGLLEASGGKVGLGQGLRPVTQQLQLFLSRHDPDPNGRYHYDGKRWSRRPGMAPAAPPGLSMHELGLAADLVGDMDWVGDNVGRFDLKTFADVNGEPWHVQPDELPNGRSAYDRNPSWGTPPWDGAGSRSSTSPSTSPSDGEAPTAEPLKLTPAYQARVGDTGAAVDVMLEALIARELLPDDDAVRDGSYDADDEEVVKSFQQRSGLHVDGIVGPQTWGALLSVVQPGDSGPKVRVAQVTLIRRGLIRDTDANRDGVYGPATQAAVGQFQEAAGLHVDREIGPATWTALIGEKKRVQVTRGGPAADTDDYDDIDILAVLEGKPAE